MVEVFVIQTKTTNGNNLCNNTATLLLLADRDIVRESQQLLLIEGLISVLLHRLNCLQVAHSVFNQRDRNQGGSSSKTRLTMNLALMPCLHPYRNRCLGVCRFRAKTAITQIHELLNDFGRRQAAISEYKHLGMRILYEVVTCPSIFRPFKNSSVY